MARARALAKGLEKTQLPTSLLIVTLSTGPSQMTVATVPRYTRNFTIEHFNDYVLLAKADGTYTISVTTEKATGTTGTSPGSLAILPEVTRCLPLLHYVATDFLHVLTEVLQTTKTRAGAFYAAHWDVTVPTTACAFTGYMNYHNALTDVSTLRMASILMPSYFVNFYFNLDFEGAFDYVFANYVHSDWNFMLAEENLVFPTGNFMFSDWSY